VGEPATIPFAQGQASGLDTLSGMAPKLWNWLPDAAGALRQRPGIRAWSDFTGVTASGSPVIGMFVWRTSVIFVTAARTIYALIAPGSVLNLGTLGGTGRPIFTYDQQRVVITGGGVPVKWEGVGAVSDLAPGMTSISGGALNLTHIAYSAQKFIGNLNDNSGVLQWSQEGPGSHATWPIVGPYYMEAEAAPDPVIAVWANTNEVFAFGTETTQVLSPDPATRFTVSASIAYGLAAPYSVIATEDGNLYWLEANRNFIESNGRGADLISSPTMAADLKSLETVSDCWGANIMIGSHDLLVWAFPTEGRTFWYDRTTKKWGEWNTLDSNGESTGWIAQSYFYWADRNLHLVGLSDGTIAELSFNAPDDNGTAIRALSETGFQDRGTFARKLCQRVQLQFRRGGTVPPATAPICELRYRDDLGNWKAAKRFSMGAAQYQPVVDAWALGMYRQRSWQLNWTGGSDFLLAGATESFETQEV